MNKKLLYFVRSLFLNFVISSKERSFTPSLRMLCLGMFFVVSSANAVTYYSKATGNVNAFASWGESTNGTGTAPTTFGNAADVFIIRNASVMTNNSTWTVAGSVIINNGGSVSLNSDSITIGNFTIDTGGSATINRPLTVTGATNISGTINFGSTSNTSRTMIFSGPVTLNTGAVWSEASSGNNGDKNTYFFADNFTNNATTFNAVGIGVHTFSGTAKILNGSTSIVIQRVAITGSYTNNINNPAALTVSTALSGSGTLTNAATKTLNVGGTSSITNLNNQGTTSISGSGLITTALANFINTGTLNLGGSGNITGITNNTNGTVNLASSGTITTFNNATSSSVLQITAASLGISTLTATATGNLVNYNGTVQTIKATSYANLILSNSGTKTFPASIVAISGNLNINSGVVANLSTVTHTAGTLTLGGTTTPSGLWGSSSSTATNINDTYFVATSGRVNVSTPTCTTPTIFTMTGGGGAFCGSSSGSAIGLSGSEIGVSYQLRKGTTLVGSAITGTGNAISFGNFNGTGSYTVLASRASTFCTAIMTGTINVFKYSTPPTPTANATNVSCPTDASGTITMTTNPVAPASVAFVSANNQYIDLGTPLLSNRSSFTIEGWIKFNPANYAERMALFGQNDIVEIGFEGNNLRCWTPYGTVDLPLASFPAGNIWHHIAFTGDATSLKFYLDGGTPRTTSVTVSNYGTNSNNTKIGYGVMDVNGVGLTGEAFKLGFWNRALSASEIITLSSGFVEYDASLSGLLAGYSFNEGTGTTVSGVGSVAPTGTLINGPQWTDPYVYSWTSTPPGFTSSLKNLTGLATGTYTLITSLKGCTSTGVWTVNSNNTTPSITTQPVTTNICVGNNTSFSIVAAGSGLTYKWQVSTGGSFSDLTNTAPYSNVTTSIMNITGASIGMNNYQYRCVVTGTCALSTTSSSVALTVNALPTAPTASVTTQPTCAVPTGTITISSPAEGTGFTYSINGTNYYPTAVFNTVAPSSIPYSVTVRNASGCTSPGTAVTVNNPSDRVWNGSIDKDWTNPANWTPNIVPTSTDCVVIPLTAKKPEIAAGTSVAIHSVTVDNAAILTVKSKAILTVAAGITVATGGDLIFEDDSSLLQTSTDNTINSGHITYKRITTDVRRYDFTCWSSPIHRTPAFTLHDVSPLTLGDKYYSFNPSTGWIISYNGVLPMQQGMGYIVRAPQTYNITTPAPFEASFVGTPNNGTIEITPEANKNILVGNPYASALDAKAFINQNAVRGVDVGSLYFWTHNSPPVNSIPGDKKYYYNTADYAVFNLTGSTASSTNGNNQAPTGFIAAAASFFIKPNSSTNIVFTNSMRVGAGNDQFYKTAKENNEGKNRLWLNFANTEGAFKQALIGYLDGATNEKDYNYDGPTISGNAYVDFYSINNTDKLTIQGRALPFDDSDLVPLGYVSKIVGDFTISIDEADGFFDTQAVYLEDKNTGKITDLRAENYTFTTQKGTFDDRFVLRYTNKTLGTGDFENIDNGLLVSVKDKAIKVTSAKEAIKEVTIFDINGKLLYDKKKVSSSELLISSLQAANQVLLVKVILENGFTTTKKVVFQ